MARLIQIRRDTASSWQSVNPVLAEGEIGYETDTKKIKIGDGTTAWNDLPYFKTGSEDFLGLTDTPTSYTGSAGKAVVVKSDETGLDFETIQTADEKVKADANDPEAGYLVDKVDGRTIDVNTDDHQLEFHNGAVIFPNAAVNNVQRVNLVQSKTGLIIPYYEYPWDSNTNTWKTDFIDMITLLKRFHDVPIMVIVNPSSGPGTTTDTVWRRAIKMIRGAGGIVLGYVYTNYTNRALNDVEADVQTWTQLYPQIDGIFVDQMTNDDDQTHRDYYTTLNLYIHSLNLIPSVGNAGSSVPSTYFLQWCADLIIIHENSTYPDESTLAGGDWEDSYREIPYWRKVALIYGQASLDKSQFRMMQKYCGYVFVTSSNDYTTTPDYLVNELFMASNYISSNPDLPNGVDLSNNTAYFDLQNLTTSASTVTIDWTKGNKAKLTLTQDASLTFIDPPGACNLVLELVQDSNGNHNVTFPSSVKWESGLELTPTKTANSIDMVALFFDGTNYFASPAYNFS